jgi:pimeloyl-ACP methyl ester carboxylesterase
MKKPNRTLLSRCRLLPALLLSAGAAFAQPFEVGHRSLVFTDPDRGNRSIPCEVYYPALAAGEEVPVADSPASFPVLGFGHGFVMTWDAYANIWEALVPAGFILVFPTTEGGFAPSHEALARDLVFVRKGMSELGGNPGSPFHGRVASASGVMGHSMGGGAAFLAAALDTGIQTLVTLAPAETNPSAIAAAGLVSRPSLIFAGGNDCVTPPPQHQLPLFESLAGDCHAYLSITGGSHCQMAESNFLCTFGEATCSPAPDITRAEQHAVINRYLLPWLEAVLRQDCAAGQQFDSTLAADPAVTYQQTCPLGCPVVASSAPRTLPAGIFPNPFCDRWFVRLPSGDSAYLRLYNQAGTLVLERNQRQHDELDTSHLPPGPYHYLLNTQGGGRYTGTVVKACH